MAESLSAINGREILMIHDSSQVERVRTLVSAARTFAEAQDRESALKPLTRALEKCERLYGWSERLEAALRVLRHLPLDRLSALEMLSVVQMLEDALADESDETR